MIRVYVALALFLATPSPLAVQSFSVHQQSANVRKEPTSAFLYLDSLSNYNGETPKGPGFHGYLDDSGAVNGEETRATADVGGYLNSLSKDSFKKAPVQGVQGTSSYLESVANRTPPVSATMGGPGYGSSYLSGLTGTKLATPAVTTHHVPPSTPVSATTGTGVGASYLSSLPSTPAYTNGFETTPSASISASSGFGTSYLSALSGTSTLPGSPQVASAATTTLPSSAKVSGFGASYLSSLSGSTISDSEVAAQNADYAKTSHVSISSDDNVAKPVYRSTGPISGGYLDGLNNGVTVEPLVDPNPPPFVAKRDRQPRQRRNEGAMVLVMNDATVEFTAGVLGGVAGFAVAGPVGAVAAATVANYLSRQNGDASVLVQKVAISAIEVYNYLVTLDSKYDVLYKTKISLEDALDKLKESEGANGEAIDKVEKSLAATVSRMAQLSDEFDLWAETTNALGFVGDLFEKTANKIGSFTKEYQLFERLFNSMMEAATAAQLAVVEATKEAYGDDDMPLYMTLGAAVAEARKADKKNVEPSSS